MIQIARSPAHEIEHLGDRIAELAAHLHAATARLLEMLAEFDRAEGWGGGFASCAHWLSWRTGIDLGAAREKVRVARALERLPRIREQLRTGVLSYAKARALTRVATPENEDALLHFALHSTAAHVERLVRAWRRVDRAEEAEQERARHASRHLTLMPDGQGMFEIRGRLDPEAAMALERALDAASWTLYRSDDARRETPAAARRADAIGLVAECALRGGLAETEPEEGKATVGRADRFTVVIHATPDADAPGNSVLEDGTRVSAETSRRLACDSGRILMTHAHDGSVLSVGRKTRTVPPAVRRALDHRDGGCCFPGCGSRFCDAHHVRHWADGGETGLDNLVLLCRLHHRAVHEEGFEVEIVRGDARFYRPDGWRLEDVPVAPRISGDPVAALVREHRAAGLVIGPETPTTRWAGEKCDLGWAVGVLRGAAAG